MNSEIALWSYSLLFAMLIIVLGVTGLLSACRNWERCQAQGLIVQGILLAWVMGTALHHRGFQLQNIYVHNGDLKTGGLLLVGLLIVQSLWQMEASETESEESGQGPLS